MQSFDKFWGRRCLNVRWTERPVFIWKSRPFEQANKAMTRTVVDAVWLNLTSEWWMVHDLRSQGAVRPCDRAVQRCLASRAKAPCKSQPFSTLIKLQSVLVFGLWEQDGESSDQARRQSRLGFRSLVYWKTHFFRSYLTIQQAVSISNLPFLFSLCDLLHFNRPRRWSLVSLFVGELSILGVVPSFKFFLQMKWA